MSTVQQRAASLSELAHEERIVAALKARRGRITLGDLLVDTGLPKAVAETQLKHVLKTYESHLEVDENGEIVYLFHPAFRRRDQGDAFKRALRSFVKTAYKTFKFLFKITIMVTLVVYFLVFVALLIAAFVAMASRGGSNSSSSSSSRRNPIFFVGRLFWAPGRRSRRGDYGYSRARSHDSEEPLYKRIFAYVFGPEANEEGSPDPFGAEKIVLAFLRSQKGVATASELATQTGWGQQEAEGRIASLMADYDGDVRVTRNGTLLYSFNGLAMSASGDRGRSPAPIWERFEKQKKLTGNGGGTDAIITFLNGFNLVAALIAPSFIMPQLQLQGALWYVGLSAFPFVFSLVFFAVPLLRWLALMVENGKRATRNTWRFVLAEVFSAARRDRALTPDATVDAVARRYPRDAAGKAARGATLSALDRAVKDYDPDIASSASGMPSYRFSDLGRELNEARRARDLIDADALRLGRIVFSSADDDLGLDQLEDFDRQLGAGAPAPLSAGSLETLDPELGAFDAQIAGGTPAQGADQDRLDEFEERLSATEKVAK